MNKFAALSPAIQALEQVPTAESQRQIFERHIGDTAYQSFAAKFPDLVESIITYKLLDTDPTAGTGFGAFILDVDGETVYVPTVFSDSELSPIEIMYVKTKGIFVPLTTEWINAVRRDADQALGESQKLPDTVSSDVDIRNLMVPPMTGRYSYASDASMELGKLLTKHADEQFDPQMWEMFVTQYGQMNGVTPGGALDAGQATADEISKLYKNHVKMWAPQEQQQQQPMPPQMQQPMQQPMAQQPVQQPPQQPQPKMASVGSKIDHLLESAGYGAAIGGGTGGLTAIYDGDPRDAGNRILQGAVGGALGGTIGGTVGRSLNAKYPKVTQGLGDEVGHIAGGLIGGLSASDPERIGLAPNPAAYDPTMYRYASFDADLLAMMKHAAAPSHKHTPRLLDYLHQAPNAVKTAFASVLKKRPHLLKFAAESYGAEALLGALRGCPEQAKVAEAPKKAVSVTTKGTTPRSFRGTALRGYFYEDQKPAKNATVIKQERQIAADAREPGVYSLLKSDGTRVAARVFVDPVDLFSPGLSHSSWPLDSRRRRQPRIAVLSGGKYLNADELYGEKVPDETDIAVGSAKPSQGLGMFVSPEGAGTLPIRLSKVRTLEGGVVEAVAGPSDDLFRGYCSKRIRVEGGRFIRPKDADVVIIPASWKWLALSGENEDKGHTFLTSADLVDYVLGHTGTQVTVRGVEPSKTAEAIDYIANTYEISGADAEALLKIAELRGRCDARIVPKDLLAGRVKTASPVEQAFGEILQGLSSQMDNIQGQMQVLQTVQQRAQELAQGAGQPPTGMQQTDPAMQGPPPAPAQGQPADPSMQAPAPAQGQPMDPSMQGQPMDPSMQGQPMDPSMQGQPMDPSMQGQPMDPSMQGQPMDPSMQGQPMDPSMQGQPMDPSMQGQPMDPSMDPATQGQVEQPPLPLMTTEVPSSMEIEQQINPDFLEQAAALQSRGAFDTGALAQLERAAGRKGTPTPAPMNSHTQSLEATVDDLGRTLLSLQLKSVDLQAQLSGDTYHELEEQVRNTFKGLGKLLLELSQHSMALTHAQDSQAA